MENKSHAIIAISFLIVFSIAAVVFIYWLSHQKSLSRTYVIITGQSVGGLSVDARVNFKGLKAGKVKSIQFDKSNPNKVRIVFRVRDSIPMTTSTYAQISRHGLTGSKTLDLSNPNPDAKPLKTSAKHPAQIPMHRSLLGQLEQSAKQDMSKFNKILGSVHKLLKQQNRQHLSQTIKQLDQATKKLVQAEKAVMPALKEMPELTKETQSNLKAARHLIGQVDKLVHQAHGPVKNASKVENSAQTLAQSANRLTRKLNDQTLPQVTRLIRSIDKTSSQIDQLTSELKSNPQSLIFGPSKKAPGPGEPGFNSSR
jgi:phospholipid/cholesterol/gamma-HCH transport system substrate-binding protein